MKKIGILDPEGLELNPLTGQEYSPSYLENVKQHKWNKLPMYSQIKPQKIIKSIMNNQVVILESGTGSGKSVLMPKYALHALDYKGKVVITNPKQLPTENNARFAAELMDVEIGKEVGFQYRDSKLENGKSSKSGNTKLLFSTDGSVVEVLRNHRDGRDYDIIIIDEAHERNLNIDLLLLLVKRALRVNSKLKLIIMSATLPGNLFYDYFSEFKIEKIFVSGKPNKPVELFYLEEKIPNNKIPEKSIEVLFEHIIDKEKEGDVLIFCNSYNEGMGMKKAIEKRLKEKALVFVMASQVKDEKLKKLAVDESMYKTEPGGPWVRKIVLGTNQLESSITIDGIVYVIDNGRALESNFDFNKIEDQLNPSVISKSSAEQRKGRAGRTKPGECFRMYTIEQYEKMERDPILDIKKRDITNDIFYSFKEPDVNTVGEMRNFFSQYIEPPPDVSLNFSVKLLHSLDMLSSEEDDGKVSVIGKKIMSFLKDVSKEARLARCLIESIANNCLWEVSAIASVIIFIGNKDITEVFYKYEKSRDFSLKEYKKIKKKFSSPLGDVFSLYLMYSFFYNKTGKLNMGRLRKECNKNLLNFNSLLKIREEHLKIYRTLRDIKYTNESDNKKSLKESIVTSLLHGYYTNIAKKDPKVKLWENYYPKKTSSYPVSKESYLDLSKEEPPSYIVYITQYASSGHREYKICSKLTKTQIDNFVKESGKKIVFKSKKKTTKKVSRKGTRIKKIRGTRDIKEILRRLREKRMAQKKKSRKSKRTKKNKYS
jgi:HrpA-like RNA helicase